MVLYIGLCALLVSGATILPRPNHRAIALSATDTAATVSCTTVGTLCGWGDVYNGGMGDLPGSLFAQASPISGLTNVASVASSEGHTVVLHADGTVWTFGQGANGELGNGTTDSTTVPVEVKGLQNIKAVAAASETSYALRSDGSVWAWGRGWDGELGNGSDGPDTKSDVPVQVQGLSNVVAISGGTFGAYALRSDGTVWAWGYGGFGELGNGAFPSGAYDDSDLPVQVSNLTNVTAIASHGANGYALLSDGTVWAWGDGQDDYLGNSSTTNTFVPEQINGLANIAKLGNLSADAGAAYAIQSDGTVWAWGRDDEGQLGDGGEVASSTLVSIPSIKGAIAVSGGDSAGYALTASGTVWAWGSNLAYALGNNSVAPGQTSKPIQVTGLTHVTALYAGSIAGFAVIGQPETTYVALGDSYSSGEGNPPYLSGTDTSSDTCHRSALSYPFKMSNDLGFYAPHFNFHACSGARIADMYQRNTSTGEPAQLSWLKQHPDSLVTFTIGGNDAHFADVMLYCAFTDIFTDRTSCQSVWSGRVNAAITQMSGTSSSDPLSLQRLYKTMASDAGKDARILAVAYPRLFPSQPPVSCQTGVAGNVFTRSDMNWINSEIKKIDDTIAKAAKAAKITYVPAYNVFAGHELCTKDPYINHAITSVHAGIRAGSFHPNLNGHNALASFVENYAQQ